ncbi:hypothetical protein D3C84_542580 [compost metagenome]
MLVGKHDDGAGLVAGDQHDLFHDVAAGRFGIDQDHVGANGFDAGRQVDGQAGFVDDLEAGLHQGGLEAADFLGGVVDQQDAQHDGGLPQGLQGDGPGAAGQRVDREAACVLGRIAAVPDAAIDQRGAAHQGRHFDAEGLCGLAVEVQPLHLLGD